MKIVLATGIYPPEIGGPATYVHALAEDLSKKNVNVTVITFGVPDQAENWQVINISKLLPILRWISYALAFRTHGKDADAVIAFSSVSAGVPLFLARLKKPKKILRLGGDFFWERYTDRGGMKSLREWYTSKPRVQWIMQNILSTFNHIIFSTRFQEEIYEKCYSPLPSHSVIENALPKKTPRLHYKHNPFRLLFMGRFVGFKNLQVLLESMRMLPNTVLTLVGSGPIEHTLEKMVSRLEIGDRVTFAAPVHGQAKEFLFENHDLLIIPSITEISPNVALEARAAGLPVLLTKETGLSEGLIHGMAIRDLSTPEKIYESIKDIQQNYERIATGSSSPLLQRDWNVVADEWIRLLSSL